QRGGPTGGYRRGPRGVTPFGMRTGAPILQRGSGCAGPPLLDWTRLGCPLPDPKQTPSHTSRTPVTAQPPFSAGHLRNTLPAVYIGDNLQVTRCYCIRQSADGLL